MQAIKEIRNDACTAYFYTVDACCGSIRVEGWISAPNRTEGFQFCGAVASLLRRECLGGFCLDETAPDGGRVLFPFSFDQQREFNRYGLESVLEAHERVLSVIRQLPETI